MMAKFTAYFGENVAMLHSGLQPVSSTHLDVYKRQVFLLALWISHVFKLNGIYFILNHMLDVGILAPVSYTHLDRAE